MVGLLVCLAALAQTPEPQIYLVLDRERPSQFVRYDLAVDFSLYGHHEDFRYFAHLQDELRPRLIVIEYLDLPAMRKHNVPLDVPRPAIRFGREKFQPFPEQPYYEHTISLLVLKGFVDDYNRDVLREEWEEHCRQLDGHDEARYADLIVEFVDKTTIDGIKQVRPSTTSIREFGLQYLVCHYEYLPGFPSRPPKSWRPAPPCLDHPWAESYRLTGWQPPSWIGPERYPVPPPIPFAVP